MQKIAKQIFILSSIIILLILPYFVFAGNSTLDMLKEAGSTEGPYDSATNQFTLSSIIGKGVNVFLSMLGIIFIILVIYGGFTYMNARGEEEKVKKGIAIIRMAIIGLVIILGAYAIWHYIYINLIV
jgi:hypothetical protein